MEELRNEIMEATEEIMETEELVEAGNGSLGKVILVVAGVGAGAAALWANRGKLKTKLNEKRAEKLRKAGYEVYEPVEAECEEVENFDAEETEE